MLTPLYEYATVEWVWVNGNIRVTFPSQEEQITTGSYGEVVKTLTYLGQQGWDIAACVASADWVYWTMKRPTP